MKEAAGSSKDCSACTTQRRLWVRLWHWQAKFARGSTTRSVAMTTFQWQKMTPQKSKPQHGRRVAKMTLKRRQEVNNHIISIWICIHDSDTPISIWPNYSFYYIFIILNNLTHNVESFRRGICAIVAQEFLFLIFMSRHIYSCVVN